MLISVEVGSVRTVRVPTAVHVLAVSCLLQTASNVWVSTGSILKQSHPLVWKFGILHVYLIIFCNLKRIQVNLNFATQLHFCKIFDLGTATHTLITVMKRV